MRRSLALAIAAAGLGAAAHSTPASAQTANWSGPYVGIEGGIGWGHQHQTGGLMILPGTGFSTILTSSTTSFDGRYNLSGGLIGGSLGYNFQFGRAILGIEGDGAWADLIGSATCALNTPLPHSCGGDIRGLETLRGRFGYDVGPMVPWFGLGNVMFFIAGGLAVGEIHAWDALSGASGDKTPVGWTFGGGIEAMLGRYWSVRLEYLHVDLGDPVVFITLPNPEHVATTAEIVRIGFHYHFWGGPPYNFPP